MGRESKRGEQVPARELVDRDELATLSLTYERWVKRITIPYIEAAKAVYLTPESTIPSSVDVPYRELIIRFIAEIACHERDVVTVEYPADWWEALKERWLPRWALDRWPVRMRTHKIRLLDGYPGLGTVRDNQPMPLYTHEVVDVCE